MERKYFETYIFSEEYPRMEQKNLVVIIYDITDNKRRLKMAHLLEKYGFRVNIQ